MKPPSDGRVGWHFYRIPQLAGLGLSWSLRLYSELHETNARRQSRVVLISQLAGLGITRSLRLYSDLHETTPRWQSRVALQQDPPTGRVRPRLELASLLGASRNHSQMAG
jgi:hypothetical protein